MSTQLIETAGHATGADLVAILRQQQARKIDVVASATQLRSRNGRLVVHGSEPILTEDGVTAADGTYRPTAVCDEGIAEKLGIPMTYLKRLRAERPDLYDANVNGWLREDFRSFTLRLFRGDESTSGVARALLSSKYQRIENLDVLMTALEGVRIAGVPAEIADADLSERRMYVRIVAPQVQALAPELLRNYRSPFTGARGTDNPVVFAGFEIGNSEVGGGAFSITPRLVVQVCKNGMQITKDVVRSVHLGGRLDDGVITWTADTQERALELVRAKTRDAVATFLNVDYVRSTLDGMQEEAETPVTRPADTIKTLASKLAYSEEAMDGILEHFIRGGDMTAGGIMQAITSYAQVVPDAETANRLEAGAVQAMALAAA